jgi:cobalamin biosynthesis protein CobT
MKTVESTRRFMRTWCKSRKIELVESALVKVPHAIFEKDSGRKIIYLPLISSVNFSEWQRISYHESAHLAPKNIWHYKLLEILSHEDGQMLQEISNCLIDNLAERVDFYEYRGRAGILSSARADLTDKLGEVMEIETPDPHHLLRSAMLKWDMINREQWMINFSAPSAHKALPHIQGYFESLEELHLDKILDAVAASDDIKDNLDTLVTVIKRIDALLPKQQTQEEEEEDGGESEVGEGEPGGSDSAGEPESSSECNNGLGEGEEAGESSDDGEENGVAQPGGGDSNSGEEESGAKESGGSEDGEDGETLGDRDESDFGHNTQTGEGTNQTEVEYSASQKELLEEYTQDLERELGMYQNSVELANKYREGTSQFYVPCKKQRRTYIPHDVKNYKSGRYNLISKMCAESSLDRKIRKHLQLQSQGRTVHGMKRGRLSGKSLHRLYNGQQNIQPAVFKKHEFGKVKMDSAVTMLVDLSGSMGMSQHSDKYALAAAAAIAFSEVLVGLRIRHEILGFTEHAGENEVYHFKSFSDKPLTRDTLAKKFSAYAVTQDYNTDGEALQYAAERLMQMKEKNKILMVMSDGMPAGHYQGSGSYYLKQVVKDVEENSPIHLCGIGIQSDSVERFYKNCEVIENMDELTPAVLNTLKKNLLTT